uniref:Immediate early response 2 n=1 Tax=Varanus komodoensis TaxID=61221 RepID=A0A8D2KT74_VARKO
MEVQKEAQRIMTMSVWKMYHSRMQRGGLRLHRSLQLSLVMRNARDLYLSAKLEEEDEMAPPPGTRSWKLLSGEAEPAEAPLSAEEPNTASHTRPVGPLCLVAGPWRSGRRTAGD